MPLQIMVFCICSKSKIKLTQPRNQVAQNDYPKEASWAGDRIIERRRVNTSLRPICASKCNGSGLQMKRNGGTIDVFGAAFPQGKRIE